MRRLGGCEDDVELKGIMEVEEGVMARFICLFGLMGLISHFTGCSLVNDIK